MALATDLVIPDCQLVAESDGLGMNAMRASHHHGGLELVGAFSKNFQEVVHPFQKDRGSFPDLKGQGRVDDIGRSQPVVEVSGRLTHVLGDCGGKRDHVVTDFGFDFFDTLDGKVRALANLLRRIRGHDAVRLKDACRCEFDLQPLAVLVLFLPDAAHDWTRISWDQISALLS